ncbi:MAG: phosphatidylglycerophosphatase A [Deltaproteobacteria bacterium]|nr:MAG: phosphatidylglycerophosphatase A [Deltaproteobacteria bacterium]
MQEKNRLNPKKIPEKNLLNIALASALGLGLSPIMPGTFGAMLGVFFHVFIISFFPSNIQLAALLIIFLIICTGNNVLTPWAENYWQCKDPKQFVLDEAAGYLLVPILFHHGKSWQIILWGFFFFRVYDIIKMPVARQIDQKMQGSWGILLDDLVSALYAVLTMYLLWWAGPRIKLEKWLISN